jgi:hypothetical protein
MVMDVLAPDGSVMIPNVTFDSPLNLSGLEAALRDAQFEAVRAASGHTFEEMLDASTNEDWERLSLGV